MKGDKVTIDAYQQHLRDIDIPAWEYQGSNGADWYTIRLFNLMAKADTRNFKKLALVYPQEAMAYHWWFFGKPETLEELDAKIAGMKRETEHLLQETNE